MAYFTFILSLLNPIYALIFSINENIKRRSSYLVILSFALAFAFISFAIKPPVEVDLYRHYLRIESFKDVPFDSLLNDTTTGYLLFDTYGWLIINSGLPIQLFTSSIVFVCYVLVLSLHKDLKARYLQNAKSAIVAFSFLMIWLSIDFVLLSSGIRSIFSNIVVLYFGYHAILKKKYIQFIFATILAFFIHPGSIGPSILIIASILFQNVFQNPKIFVIIGIVLMIGSNIVYTIINYISAYLSNFSFYSAAYLSEDSSWGAAALQSRNLNGIIGDFIISRFPGYIAILYLLLTKSKHKDPLYLFLCFSSLYLGLFFQYFTIYERFNSFFVSVFSVFIILEYIKAPNNFNKLFVNLFLLSLVLYSTFNLYRYYSYLSSASDVLYKPLLLKLFDI